MYGGTASTSTRFGSPVDGQITTQAYAARIASPATAAGTSRPRATSTPAATTSAQIPIRTASTERSSLPSSR